ncbi:MAG: class I SAM-dependent methyltransferase, partial [Candidatus Hodarchaeota archaeon]
MQQSKRDVCSVNDATKFLRSKKTNKSPDYGSWVPKPFLYSFLGVGLIFLLVSHFIPIPLFAQLILWGFAGIACLGFLSMGYLYYVFNRNGSEIQNRLRDMVLNRLTWDGTGKALDIGTGNGPLAINMAKKFPKATVTGIDSWGIGWGYSKESCENNARIEGVQERVWFQNASAASLPFEDGEFDAVVSNFVFHEVRDAKDKRNLIKEALRVLWKGGAFSF